MRGHVTLWNRGRLSTRNWGNTWGTRCSSLEGKPMLLCVLDPIGNTVLSLNVAVISFWGEVVLCHGSAGWRDGLGRS